MTLERIKATEHRLLQAICTFEEYGAYTLFRADAFPGYYLGNGISISNTQGLALHEWEQIFKQHFDPHTYKHITFTLQKNDSTEQLMREAHLHGYHVEQSSYMYLTQINDQPPPNSPWELHRIQEEADWERYEKFYDEVSHEEDWYDPAHGITQLFQKMRATSDAIGIEWYYLSPKGSDEMLVKAGMFEHNGLYRLQDIVCAPPWRRRGLATHLIRLLIHEALTLRKAQAVALMADVDYVAIQLYRKLGFVECGQTVCLMKYPTNKA